VRPRRTTATALSTGDSKAPLSPTIVSHFSAQYIAWERMLYPTGRKSAAATIDVREGLGESGYDTVEDSIVIFVAEGDVDDLEARAAEIRTAPDKWNLHVNEIELLHEMVHEMQFKELAGPSADGIALHATTTNHFAGPGHDETFYTAVIEVARQLRVTAAHLLQSL
jgi:hypothetical protein